MLTFKKITYKNFLSVGNNPIKLDLNSSTTTLIVGGNGEGKSILLDALSYVLFNKPHRNVNKPQLINTINDKDSVVTLEFGIGSDEYKIIRGQKPNIFEIWKNDNMLNQNSKARDYQKVLEQSILKLNHRSFHQIVVLGSSSFVPFMQLPKWHRREVIEDLLDISIFSKMNGTLKDKRNLLKNTNDALQSEIDALHSQAQLQKKHIKKLCQISNEDKSKIEAEINEMLEEVKVLEYKYKEIEDELSQDKYKETAELSKFDSYKQKLHTMEIKAKNKHTNLIDRITFYQTHDECPTCKQNIDLEMKTNIVKKSEAELEKIVSNLTLLESEYSKTMSSLERIQTLVNEHSKHSNAMSRIQFQVDSINKNIQKKRESSKNTSSQHDIVDANKVLLEIITNIQEKQDEKGKNAEVLTYYGLMEELLKDSGIKTKVVKQYLPVINKLINEYLHIFDFFVSFSLDEEFIERIRSRHRDDFSYASFSEGEKSRIDLALMFTWRQIAKIKNSTNTNLLILDETFDSSLDTDGVDNLLKVLYQLDKNTNTFIISHKNDVLEGRFDNKIEFKKVHNFTQMSSSIDV